MTSVNDMCHKNKIAFGFSILLQTVDCLNLAGPETAGSVAPEAQIL